MGFGFGFVIFALVAEGFEEVAVGGEAVFAGDRVFEKEGLERVQGEGHVGAEEDEKPDAGEVGAEVGHGGEFEDGVEGELAEEDCHVEGENIDNEDGAVGELLVGVEDEGDDDY